MFDRARAPLAFTRRRAVRPARGLAMRVIALLALLWLGLVPAVDAATVPSGFVDGTYVEIPTDATAMQFAPDGRLFVCQQSGKLRVVQDGRLLATPFLTVPVDANGERGLLGVAFDPDFERNQFVYVYYTATSPTIHNRVSRFTANGNVAVPGSERVLLDLDPLSSARNHNGGAIHFGNDGKLYVAVGDNANADHAQTLSNRFGKVLRINRDGSIPTANPFYTRATGVNRAIWALGLRNPFTTAFQRSSGRLFINDVGLTAWEEINEGEPGANYGWPVAEGPTSNPAFTSPVHAYSHVDGACAITGGAFYEPDVLAFPGGYHGQYFFADFCANWIRRFNPQTGAVAGFATGVQGPVDLKVGADGALYYLARREGRVGRISYASSQPPVITLQPASRTVAVGQSATFKVSATGTTPLSYQWRRNGAAIAGATGSSYTRTNVQPLDDGAFFDVVVSNAFGRAVSDSAQLTVLQDAGPSASITQPVAGTTYAAGTTIRYAGTASDAEDGVLPASAFTWWVDLHHESHTHPHVLPVTGSKTGSFWIPVSGETSAKVFYRIHLRVRDSAGLTRSVSRDVLPRKRLITLDTNPTGLQLKLDGRTVTTPHSFVGVVGIRRTLEAPSPQVALGGTWVFGSWSDGGARTHTIRTPSTKTTYTARFVAQ
jgi:glucose/arabinose dehydrogenase